jgi:hypothetical protein
LSSICFLAKPLLFIILNGLCPTRQSRPNSTLRLDLTSVPTASTDCSDLVNLFGANNLTEYLGLRLCSHRINNPEVVVH